MSPSLDQVVPALVAAITSGVLADAPVAILAITVADFTVVAMNRVLGSQFGLDAAAAVGLPMTALMPPAIHAEVEELARRLADGEVTAATVRYRCSSDAGHDWFLGRFVAVRDEGRAALLLAYCDTSGIQGECDRFEWDEVTALAARPGDTPLVLLADASWRVTSSCPALQAELHRCPADLAGARVSDLVHPDDLPVLVAALAEVTSLHRPHAPLSLRLQRGDNTWAETSTAVTPVAGADGTGLAFLVFAEGSAVQSEVGHRLAELERSVNRLVEEFERNRPAPRNPAIAALEQLPGAGMLSSREREVLELVAEGYRVSTIARELFVSPSTVRNHLSAIFRKLGVGSQAELLERLRSVAAGERDPA